MLLLLEKKVLLFGKTGEGKSTVANMLVSGNLGNPVFEMGDGMSGVTETTNEARGRGYHVVDTVGLGEETEGESTNDHAVKLIHQYLEKTQGEYSHIIFVKRAGRFDKLDSAIWKTFKEVFEGAEAAFMVVVTHCSNPERWFEQNQKKVKETYGTSCWFAFVNFPAVSSSFSLVVRKSILVERKLSLERLENAIDLMFTQNSEQYFRRSFDDPQSLRKRATAIWNILKGAFTILCRSSYWMKLWRNIFK